jgi:RNase P subunit RPR2
MKKYQPIKLVCKDCREQFIWGASEQVFYEERNLVPPKRCRECRIILRRKETERLRLQEAKNAS